LAYFMLAISAAIQSTPMWGLFCYTYIVLAFAVLAIESRPEFSAKAIGIYSKALAKALTAYYSTVEILSDCSYKCRAQAISQAPPP